MHRVRLTDKGELYTVLFIMMMMIIIIIDAAVVIFAVVYVFETERER